MASTSAVTTLMPRDLPSSLDGAVRLIGADTVVPCVDGRARRYVNLDYAASAPVMDAVWAAVESFLPWYSSVHRGSGVKSQVSTAAFEDARETVAEFVGARADDAVVFVRNTTEAINVLSAALPAATRVLSSAVEHHSNIGLGTTRHDIDRLIDALCEIAETGPRSRYVQLARLDEYHSDPRGATEPAMAPLSLGSTASELGPDRTPSLR
jgi:hypothetical protein